MPHKQCIFGKYTYFGEIMKKNKRQDKIRNTKFFQKIQIKLAGAFLLPVVFIVILGVASYKEASGGIISSYEESLDKAIGLSNQFFALTVDSVQNMYKSYVNDNSYTIYFSGWSADETAETSSYLTFTQNMKSAIATDSSVCNVMFLSDKVKSVVTTGSTADGLYTEYISTPQGEMLKENTFGYFLFGNNSAADEALNTSSEVYGLRLARHMQEYNGVMLIDIDKRVVIDALESMNVGDGAIVGIITTDGTELLSDGSNPEEPIFADSDFYAKALESEALNGNEYVMYDGEEYFFEYSKIDQRDAMICALIPKSILTEKASSIRILTIVLVFIASLVAVFVGVVIAGGFGKSIKVFIKQFNKVASGDLTATIKTKRKDEFSLLAHGANGMINTMNGLISNITELSNGLAKASTNVMNTAERLLDSSEKIQISMENIDTGTSTLNEGSEKCLEQMDGLSERINEISVRSGEIVKITQASKDAINQGQNSISTLTESASATSTITSNVIQAIEQLNEKTAVIGQIVKAINDIASQTNLLSLNASIEAARAGDAGKGFAVVAEEIRKLAEESGHSAERISKIIAEISANTKEVVDIANDAKVAVDGQEAAVALMEKSFDLIKEHTEKFIESLELINTNVKNMDTARKETLNAMESVSAVSVQTSSETSSVHKNTAIQTEQISQLDTEADKLKKEAMELNSILSKFRTE